MAFGEAQTNHRLFGALGYFNFNERRAAQKEAVQSMIGDLLFEAGIRGFSVEDNTPEACDETDGGRIVMTVKGTVADDVKHKILDQVDKPPHLFPIMISFLPE